MHTLDNLRKHAELNLCQKCYPVYLATLEPTIKAMLKEYLHDWQGIEVLVRGLMLEHMGAFKDHKMFLLDFDDKSEDLGNYLELEVYKEFKRTYRWFPSRIAYLRDNGVIGDSLYLLLGKLNSRRNRIHKYETELPEDLRVIFHMTYSWLQWIQIARANSGFPEGHLQSTIKNAEQFADKISPLLSTI